MNWLNIISVTVLISSAFCGSLNRRTKKHAPTEQADPGKNNEPLISYDELQYIFGPPEVSPTPSTNSTLQSTTKDSEPLDKGLRQLSDMLIEKTKELPVDGVLETSTQNLQSTTKDSEPLDPDLLSNIFSDTLIDETKDLPVDGILETNTLESTTKDSEPLEPDLLSDIFSGLLAKTSKKPRTNSGGTLLDETKESPDDGVLKGNTQDLQSTTKDSDPLDPDLLAKVFSDMLKVETKESPVEGELETSAQDLQSTIQDSEPLDKNNVRQLFPDTLTNEILKPPVDGVPETSTQHLQSTIQDSEPLEPDLLSEIFSETLTDETKESPVDGVLETSTQDLHSTTKDSETLDPDLLAKIFSDTLKFETKETPVKGELETSAQDLQSTIQDSEPLAENNVRQLFPDTPTNETLKPPVDGVLETSTQYLQSTIQDSEPLEPDFLSEIFSETLTDETKETPVDGVLETSTQDLQSTTQDSEPLDETFLDEIFSGKVITVTTGSPDDRVPKTSTQADKFNVDIDNRIGYEPTDDFNFVDIDWDDDDDDIENTTADSHLSPRAYDGNTDDAHPTSNEKITLTYPIDEIDPPLEDVTPKVPTRIDVNKTSVESTTTSGEDIRSSEENTEPIIEMSTDDEVIPKQCKYGTDEFPIPKPNVKKEGRRIADIKCEEQMLDVKYNVYDVSKYKLICNQLREITSIIGGTQAMNKQFPHMGGVGWLNRENKYTIFCGSTLISPRFTLTAAHCRSVSTRADIGVDDPYPKIVRFGNVDIEKTSHTFDVQIEEFLTLKEYDANPLMRYNDIGLIRLATEVKFAEHVRPACLWHKSMAELKTGNVTGWGLTVSAKIESKSQHLRYAEVDIPGNETCNEHLTHRNFRHWKGLSDTQFCAGKLEGGIDTCQGDSGGPLQVRESFSEEKDITVHYVVGITSFGFDCGKPKLPGLYTSVNKYLCWIEKTVWPSENNTMCNED